jgi:hypothetical protein
MDRIAPLPTIDDALQSLVHAKLHREVVRTHVACASINPPTAKGRWLRCETGSVEQAPPEELRLKSAKRLAIAIALLCLQACSTQGTAHKRLDDVTTSVLAYANQLVSPGDEFAVLSAMPRPIDDVLRRSPYLVESVDGKKLAYPGFTLTEARPLPRDMAFVGVKLPLGVHDIVIMGGNMRSKSTTFKEVAIEPSKRYLIVDSVGEDGNTYVHIAECALDTRFSIYEKDRYVPAKQVTQKTLWGALK